MKASRLAGSVHANPSPDPENSPEKKQESFSETLRKLGPYLNIGYMFVASVLVLAYLGWLVDRKWSTLPWFTLLGAFLGLGVGFYNFFRVVSRPPEDSGDDEPS